MKTEKILTTSEEEKFAEVLRFCYLIQSCQSLMIINSRLMKIGFYCGNLDS